MELKKNGSELSDNLSDTQFFAFENIDKKKLTAEKKSVMNLITPYIVRYLLQHPIQSKFRSKRLFERSYVNNRQYVHLSMVLLYHTFDGMPSNRASHFRPT